MQPTLTKKAKDELKDILKKEFRGASEYPEELIEDFGLTLLNLTTIALKRRAQIHKQKN